MYNLLLLSLPQSRHRITYADLSCSVEQAAAKAKEAIPGTKGEAKGKVSELTGEAKGKTEELKGKAQGTAAEVEGKVKGS